MTSKVFNDDPEKIDLFSETVENKWRLLVIEEKRIYSPFPKYTLRV